MNHVHVSAMSMLIFIAQLLIAGLLIRAVAAKYADTAFGKALGAIY